MMLIPALALTLSLMVKPEKELFLFGVEVVDGPRHLSVAISLKNDSKRPILLWDPLNYESRASIKLLVRDAKGKETDITPLPAPRGTGVATAVTLKPGDILRLPAVDIQPTRPKGAVGKLYLIVIYRNKIAERDAVKGVWTGEIRSQLIYVRALNKR